MLSRKNLHGYQKTSVNHIIENPSCGLFLEMGLGKTVSTLTAVDDLINDMLEIDTCLVIGPKRVAENVWHKEIGKWAHLTHLTVSRVIGTAAQRIHALRKKADIYVIGRDNVSWLVGQYGGSMLPFDMVVLDESSSFKNHKSQRFKDLRKVIGSVKRVVALTGTPAPNGLLDLWAQIYLLDQGQRLGKFITHYREDFFTRNGHSHFSKHKIREGAEEKIFKRISDICISMKAADYLELPGRVENMIDIELSDKLRKAYKEFEREQVMTLIDEVGQDGEITAVNAAALTNKLLQFANGAVYGDPSSPDRPDDKKAYEIHNLKLDVLEEIIDSSGGKPVLIAYTYKHDFSRIHARFKKRGLRHIKEKGSVDAWNNKDIPILAMHPASGGHGLNLQDGGNILVWFGQTWSLELQQQMDARLDRQGQREKVFIHHLICKGTVDERVLAARTDKDQKQEGLMSAVKYVESLIKKYK